MDRERKYGKGLHIAHLNVRSMMSPNTFDVLSRQIAGSDIDIFTLSETWLHEAIPTNLLELGQYDLVRLDRNWGEPGLNNQVKKGGGLACYVKKGIKHSSTEFIDLNVSTKDIEMQWISVDLPSVRQIVIVNIYRPPQGDYKACCKVISEAFLKANLRVNAEVYLLGDFNINFDDRKSLSYKELDFTTRSLNLKQYVPSPTRITFRDGTCNQSKIDLIFTNSEFIHSARVLDLNLSDHQAVMITRKKVYVKPHKVSFVGRSYKNYVKEDFQAELQNANWGPFYNSHDPNFLWLSMENIIAAQIDKSCPMKFFRVNERREPWMTNEALEEIKDKDRLLSRAKITRREDHWEVAKRARNEVGRNIRNLRADFLKQQQVTHKSDPKKFWQTVSEVIPSSKAKPGEVNLKDKMSNQPVGSENTANFFNNFFTKVGPNLAKKFDSAWIYHGDKIAEGIQPFTTDVDEVIELCKGIETYKSAGLDKLSSKVCKDAFLALPDQLAYIFNCSLISGIFPDAWKIAKVVPLFKGGNREDVNNYRPVSLLPLPGKILEKIVHKKVTAFLEVNNFLCAHQGGFRRGFSTVSTIADLTDDMFNAVNDGYITLAAFIDFRKAFDTVDLNILKSKLYEAGIRGSIFDWCASYLQNRSQRTVANNLQSHSLPITCGVPQGSVLGPLFFLVYINDLSHVLNDCKVKLYADDTVIYKSSVDHTSAAEVLQRDLDRFCKWCDENKLTVNSKKTKLMVFGSRSRVKKAKNVEILINGEFLQLVPSFKYLGLILDSTLNFNQHITSMIRTVLHKTTLLSKVKRYLRDEVALQIYKSMILPYFDYADSIYHRANTSDLDKLQRLQNRCLKIFANRDKRFSTDQAHKLASVPFLKDRRKAHVLNFMYKRQGKRELMNTREIRTRAHDAPLFNVTIPRCEAFKRSIGYFGSEEWNSLAPAIRNTDSYLAFKFLQKKLMLAPLSLIVAQ